MSTQWVLAELLAHQAVQSLEALAHVLRFGGHINLRRRTQTEHLHRLGNTDQSRQLGIAEPPAGLDPPSIAEHQYETSIWFGRRSHPHSDQPLPSAVLPPKVAAQRTE